MTLSELWKELKDRLRVGYETTFLGDGANEPTVRVSFSVTNISGPMGPDQPEITFEQVVLKVGTPPKWQSYDLGTLASQQSVTCIHQCPLAELPDLEYDLGGNINPQEFFRAVWHSPIRALKKYLPGYRLSERSRTTATPPLA